MKHTLILLAAALGACAPTTAVVNGQRVSRPTLAYSDNFYYGVTHWRAYPEHRGPSAGLHAYGGRITGFACGADLNYETSYHGRELRVLGFVQPQVGPIAHDSMQQPAYFFVRDEALDGGGRRHFTGSVGDDMGGLFVAHDRPSKVVDFALSRDSLTGQIASRRFDLHAVDEDTLAGTVVIANAAPQPFELRGISAVWSMPAADQAAILPFMLSCSQVEEGRKIEGAYTDSTLPLLVVDFRHRG
jgi:hypothetical protein